MTLKNNRGFTLIEILVVVSIIATIGGVIAGIFIVSLRTATKSNNITLIRQNGNYALSQVSRMIRYAQSVDGLSNAAAGPFAIDATTCPLPPTVPSAYQYLKATGVSGYGDKAITFSCSQSTSTLQYVVEGGSTIVLLDHNLVKIQNYCTITCSRASDTAPPNITISFDLSNANAGQTQESQVVTIPFQTSISPRNYQ